MDADLSRLPTGNKSWCALIDHCLTLGDGSEATYLELKGRLPFSPKAERTKSAVTLARAILAMANRMPGDAARHFAGYGVIVVGVYKGTFLGCEEIDPADLTQALEPYLGTRPPAWDCQTIKHQQGQALAIMVNPPQWGDPIYACWKEYQPSDDKGASVNDGDIFVRDPGRSRRAKAADIIELEGRLLRARETATEFKLSYDGFTEAIDVRAAEKYVQDMIDDYVKENAPHPVGDSPLMRAMGAPALGISAADREAYRSQLKTWRDRATNRVPEVAVELLRHDLAEGIWSLTNTSENYFRGVQVRITVPSNITALIKGDTRYCDHGGRFDVMSLLPEKPHKPSIYGVSSLQMGALRAVAGARPFVPPMDVGVQKEGSAYVIVWDIGDVRPGATVTCDEPFALLLGQDYTAVSRFSWRLTAQDVNHIFAGSTEVPCRHETHGPEGEVVQG